MVSCPLILIYFCATGGVEVEDRTLFFDLEFFFTQGCFGLGIVAGPLPLGFIPEKDEPNLRWTRRHSSVCMFSSLFISLDFDFVVLRSHLPRNPTRGRRTSTSGLAKGCSSQGTSFCSTQPQQLRPLVLRLHYPQGLIVAAF